MKVYHCLLIDRNFIGRIIIVCQTSILKSLTQEKVIIETSVTNKRTASQSKFQGLIPNRSETLFSLVYHTYVQCVSALNMLNWICKCLLL